LLKTYWYSEFFASDLVTVTNAALGPENAVHGNLFAYRLFRLRRSTLAKIIFLIAYLRKYAAYLFLCKMTKE